MHTIKKLGTLFLLSLAIVSVSRAELKLPGIITDHMVLQQNLADPIWGWDTPGTKISVAFAGQNYATTAGADGKWMVKLAPRAASAEPQTLTVIGSSKKEIHDVLIGEVWLCSGQSNMEMGIGEARDGAKEIAAADYPTLRLLMVPNLWKPEPQTDQAGAWKTCTPANVAQGGWNGFSATAYYFGRELQRQLNVPVGLVDADWGGTRIESWTAPESFAAVPALHSLAQAVQLADARSSAHQQRLEAFLHETESWLAAARDSLVKQVPAPAMPVYPTELLPPHDLQNPTALYNGMIHPVQPFGLRGSIWYQGEANNGEGMLYAEKMKALVGGWRQLWGEGDFPFYFVQIAPFNYGGRPEKLSELWEAQAAAAREIPNTCMAVINDIGDLANIHPKNKQEVGRRLALLALAKTYGQTNLVCSGPAFERLTIVGNSLRVQFAHADGGLVSRNGQPLNWFEIIDAENGGFVPATAQIDGDTVVLSAPEVPHPVALRFAWSQLAEPNLMNGAGLPAGAFRAGDVPHRDWLGMNVPEAKTYQLVYDLDLSKLGPVIRWDVDNHGKIHQPFDRIAYCLELADANGVNQSVYVSMDAFTDALEKIGVPTIASGAHFQTEIAHLNIFSNVKNLVTGTNLSGGNIEFWPNNYGPNNIAKVPNASSAAFDFGDEPAFPPDGYGSMQIHNHAARQTIFALNHWREGQGADLGIGNAPTGNLDWTFAANAGNYPVKRLRILVHCP